MMSGSVADNYPTTLPRNGQAQVLFLQGNDAKQIEAMIDMPERLVNRFVGRTPVSQQGLPGRTVAYQG